MENASDYDGGCVSRGGGGVGGDDGGGGGGSGFSCIGSCLL